LAARVCPRGVRCLPALRRARARFSAGVCEHCQAERMVAFSCKKRGFCPSCGARGMAESARHLVEEVFGARPVRQWVLSFPYPLRFLFASKPEAIGPVLGIVQRVIAGWLADQ